MELEIQRFLEINFSFWVRKRGGYKEGEKIRNEWEREKEREIERERERNEGRKKDRKTKGKKERGNYWFLLNLNSIIWTKKLRIQKFTV